MRLETCSKDDVVAVLSAIAPGAVQRDLKERWRIEVGGARKTLFPGQLSGVVAGDFAICGRLAALIL